MEREIEREPVQPSKTKGHLIYKDIKEKEAENPNISEAGSRETETSLRRLSVYQIIAYESFC